MSKFQYVNLKFPSRTYEDVFFSISFTGEMKTACWAVIRC